MTSRTGTNDPLAGIKSAAWNAGIMGMPFGYGVCWDALDAPAGSDAETAAFDAYTEAYEAGAAEQANI